MRDVDAGGEGGWGQHGQDRHAVHVVRDGFAVRDIGAAPAFAFGSFQALEKVEEREWTCRGGGRRRCGEGGEDCGDCQTMIIVWVWLSSWCGQCQEVHIPASTDHGSEDAGLFGSIGVNELSRSALGIARGPLVSGAAGDTIVFMSISRKFSEAGAVGGVKSELR